MRMEEVHRPWKSQFRPHHIKHSLWCLEKHCSFILTPQMGRMTWELALWLRNWVELLGFWLKTLLCSRWCWPDTMHSCAEISRLLPNKLGSRIVALIRCVQAKVPAAHWSLAITTGVSGFPKWPCKIAKFPPLRGKVITGQVVGLGAVFPEVFHDLGQSS